MSRTGRRASAATGRRQRCRTGPAATSGDALHAETERCSMFSCADTKKQRAWDGLTLQGALREEHGEVHHGPQDLHICICPWPDVVCDSGHVEGGGRSTVAEDGLVCGLLRSVLSANHSGGQRNGVHTSISDMIFDTHSAYEYQLAMGNTHHRSGPGVICLVPAQPSGQFIRGCGKLGEMVAGKVLLEYWEEFVVVFLRIPDDSSVFIGHWSCIWKL